MRPDRCQLLFCLLSQTGGNSTARSSLPSESNRHGPPDNPTAGIRVELSNDLMIGESRLREAYRLHEASSKEYPGSRKHASTRDAALPKGIGTARHGAPEGAA